MVVCVRKGQHKNDKNGPHEKPLQLSNIDDSSDDAIQHDKFGYAEVNLDKTKARNLEKQPRTSEGDV